MRFPYAEVEFESTGALHDPDQRRAALELVASSDVTDVLVLAHGWNNDMAAARRLFEQLTDSIATARDRVDGADERRIVVIGVLWPSVRWADEDQLAGGGAGAIDEATALRDAIDERVADPTVADELASLVSRLEESSDARARFLELLREQLPDPPEADEEPPPPALVDGDTAFVFDAATVPDDDLDGIESTGGAMAGGAATLPDVAAGVGEDGGAAGFGFGRVLRGARSLLNLTTYYTMKDRAGGVGTHGVAPLLDAVAAAAPDARVHVAGHSFGARVAAAAAATAETPVHALVFLQGAFSHHALAQDYDGKGNDGVFRAILSPAGQVTGSVVVTHTANDRAVGIAYALASRLARQQAAGVGGPNDRYGGIGRNGALETPEVAQPAGELLEVGARYSFTPGAVHNLLADRFVGSHSAVAGPEVGYALLTAMVTP